MLRGFAVFLVIAGHYFPGSIPGGFLGVDVFFVISGFLMAQQILRAHRDGDYTPIRFYAKRLARLMPAVSVVCCTAALVGWAILDPYEYRSFFYQLIGAVTGFANIVLLSQDGYFSSGAALKPLLHQWSLSVEEQYYLLLPLAFAVREPRWRMWVISGAGVLSLGLCLAVQSISPTTAFFLLPTRAWELLLGTWLGLISFNRRDQPNYTLWRVIAAAVLVLVPLVAGPDGHPGVAAVGVCLATAVWLLPARFELPAWSQSALAIGDRSYALYLVHWPVLALMRNVELSQTRLGMRLVALFVSVALAEILYRLVDKKAVSRSHHNAGMSGVRTALISVGLTVVLSAIAVVRIPEATLAVRKPNFGLGPQCASNHNPGWVRTCATADDPSILVWGDSVAMHLVPGLVSSTKAGVVQATRSGCGPFLGLAPFNRVYAVGAARKCIAWNDEVAAYLERTPSIRTVILSSVLSPYLVEGEPGWALLLRDEGDPHPAYRNDTYVLASLNRTAARIRQLGRKVVLVSPPPRAPFDAGRCQSRRHGGYMSFGGTADCSFDRSSGAVQAGVDAFLQRVSAQATIPLVNLAGQICTSGWCQSSQEGHVIYRDDIHLTDDGSRFLGKRYSWGTAFVEAAR